MDVGVKMVKFCPKCGGMMVPKKSDKKKRGVFLVCRRCGYKVSSYAKDYNLKEKVEKRPDEDVMVMEKDVSLET